MSCSTSVGRLSDGLMVCRNQIDVISVATHVRGGLQDTLFGSAAQHVLRESGLLLLVVCPSIASPRTVQRAQV